MRPLSLCFYGTNFYTNCHLYELFFIFKIHCRRLPTEFLKIFIKVVQRMVANFIAGRFDWHEFFYDQIFSPVNSQFVDILFYRHTHNFFKASGQMCFRTEIILCQIFYIDSFSVMFTNIGCSTVHQHISSRIKINGFGYCIL